VVDPPCELLRLSAVERGLVLAWVSKEFRDEDGGTVLIAGAGGVGDADLVVIGSGPGGYVAAIKAAQLGMKVRSPCR